MQAVENFHAAEGHYPAKLDELVPTYLAKVPRASPRMSFDKFDYIAVPPGDKPFLMWVVIPPFGRRTYDFEKKQGSSID